MYAVELGNGHPLPGWGLLPSFLLLLFSLLISRLSCCTHNTTIIDYCFMSDCWDLANSWYVLDELGYVNQKLTSWWPTAIVNLIHNVDPAKTHFRWLGDTQSDTYFANYNGYIVSFTTNCIYNAERYGYTKEAAWGRFWLDRLPRSSDADPMLWFTRSYDSTSPRIDYTTDPTFPRYIMGGVGPDQKMGFGYFRSDFTTTATWGGFAGVGNYLVDHMNNIHGSFFFYRNGEYLTTDPHQYGGEVVGPIWNNLAIYNSAEDDFGGPLQHINQGAAFIERARVETGSSPSQDLFYAVVNASQSYNLPYKKWASCQTCRQPVLSYRRHFLYDGGDYALVVDWVNLVSPSWTAWRIRTNGKTAAPTKYGNNGLYLPSDTGSYRTLVRFLYPAPSSVSWTITNETQLYAKVKPGQIDPNHRGFACAANRTGTAKHVWFTALHLGSKTAGTTQLDSAALITDAGGNPMGALFGSTVFISMDGYFSMPLTFSTTSGTPSGARVLVADIPTGCYSVSSDGSDLGLYPAYSQDNTVLFTVPKAGSQTITINGGSGCPTKPSSTPAPKTTATATAAPATATATPATAKSNLVTPTPTPAASPINNNTAVACTVIKTKSLCKLRTDCKWLKKKQRCKARKVIPF